MKTNKKLFYVLCGKNVFKNFVDFLFFIDLTKNINNLFYSVDF